MSYCLLVGSWRLPTKEEHLGKLQLKRPIPSSPKRALNVGVFRRLISPLDLYCYLQARFGRPNGFQNLLKSDSSDNLIHWQYELLCGEDWLDISGFTTSVHIRFWTDKPLTKQDWSEFAANVKRDFSSYGERKSKALKALEKWRLFINPYKRIKDATDNLSRDVAKLASREFPKVDLPSKKSQFRRYEILVKEKIENNRALQEKGLALKFLTPVLAESFVNMIIFLTCKPEVRGNERVYQDTVRKQIDIRVATMPLFCVGFPRGIDINSDQYKDFKRVMDSRNDFLHGNVDPIRFGFEDVYFDNKTPLFKEGHDLVDMISQNALRFIEPNTLIAELEAVRKFCNYILDQMHPYLRQGAEVLLDSVELGWNTSDRRIGALLSPNMAEMMLGDISNVFYDDI